MNSLMFCGQTGGQEGSRHLSFLKSYYVLEGFVFFLIYILEDILGLSEGDIRVALCQVSALSPVPSKDFH